MKKIGKKEILIRYLKENGSITSFEAFSELFDTRLSDTIYRLQKDGYQFARETIKKTGYYGKQIFFYRYHLLNPELELKSEIGEEYERN